ncbi:hypothetical protein [Rhodococcus zopfii]|uniref:hypothetical protein n=1 Tax=Rhodococcus zopfii TaxID=43772 RepID=UPI0009328495|nr:hypothetical protein [Rhodococcus zopfii]
MTSKDPSLWELLGLDRNDTIPVLLEELWERILEIATDPDTPDAGVDLIPDEDVVPEDELTIEPTLVEDPSGADAADADDSSAAELAEPDYEDAGHSSECDPVFDPADPGLGTDDFF